MSQFRITRLSNYSNESILKEIRRVAAQRPGQILTISTFEKEARVNITTVRRRFGSWEAALESAGIGANFSGQRGAKPPRQLSDLSDTEILERIRAIANEKTGNVEVKDIDRYCGFSSNWVRKRFGKPVRHILEELGLPVSASGKDYSKSECLENLLSVWTHYGRQPKYLEMNLPPSSVGAKAYLRFGSWMKAIEALLEDSIEDTANEDATEKPKKLPAEAVSIDRPVVMAAATSSRTTPLSIRFEVLKRDNFKCVLCGNSPATDSKCKLHVDHIVPFSKGGASIADNLRSLCNLCNIGRSDNHLD